MFASHFWDVIVVRCLTKQQGDRMNSKTKVVVACLACLLLGYFIGREHIKYQMRSAMQDAVKEFQSGMASALGGGPASPEPEPEKQEPARDQPVSAALVKKGFSPKDIYNDKFDDEITLSVMFNNKTGKEIRAFDGTLTFTDLLGNEIISSGVAINEKIPAGGSLPWDGSLEYNQFIDRHERFAAEPQENLKMTFTTGKVLFADGSTKEY